MPFPELYAAALRTHLKERELADFRPALRLGHHAVSQGIEILQLARVHEQAVVALGSSGGTQAALKRAEKFFTEASHPIVETHQAARQSKIDLDRLAETLSERTLELAATNRQLQRGIFRRNAVESALKKSREHYRKLLKDSLQLQDGLRRISHQLLASQEADRKKISQRLQSEIAQTLLGINVRLHALKAESKLNIRGLKNEFASTRRVVAKSTQSVREAAREFRNP